MLQVHQMHQQKKGTSLLLSTPAPMQSHHWPVTLSCLIPSCQRETSILASQTGPTEPVKQRLCTVYAWLLLPAPGLRQHRDPLPGRLVSGGWPGRRQPARPPKWHPGLHWRRGGRGLPVKPPGRIGRCLLLFVLLCCILYCTCCWKAPVSLLVATVEERRNSQPAEKYSIFLSLYLCAVFWMLTCLPAGSWATSSSMWPQICLETGKRLLATDLSRSTMHANLIFAVLPISASAEPSCALSQTARSAFLPPCRLTLQPQVTTARLQS